MFLLVLAGCGESESQVSPDAGEPSSGSWTGDACYEGSLGAASTPDRAAAPASCQYQNKFAGADCKLYIGADWDVADARESDCGSGFVEEDARLVRDCCPSEVEGNAPIGGCRVGGGTSAETFVIAYEGDPAATQTACENFQNGVWEPNGDVAPPAEPTHEPTEAALEALASSDDQVQITNADCLDLACLRGMVERGETFDFVPQGEIIAGVAFYPGGGVDPRAYAVMARYLAEQGLLVSIIPMENFLALSGVGRADDVQAAHPTIESWFVVGHSLGGTMAVANALTPGGDDKAGFVIWASVPGSEYDYSDGTKPTLSVWATLDSGNDEEQVEANKRYLPPHTEYVRIDRGIHAYFGDYTDFENPAGSISRDEQQAQVIEATMQFIRQAI